MKKYFIMILLILISCSKKPEIHSGKQKVVSIVEKLTKNQQEAYNSASLEFKAYMDSCLEYSSWRTCYDDFRANCNKQTGIGVGDIAVGTAIGRTASKLIIGK